MPDSPLHLGFEEAPTPFEGPTQNARVWTEHWVRNHLFCPNCGASRVRQFVGNRPVADFFCSDCREEYELKSQKGRFGPRVTDGAFRTMCERVASANNPSLILLNYDAVRRTVTNLFFVPKHFFVREVIQPRKPLAPTARRAGWIGCNILLSEIPDAGKIYVVRDGEQVSRSLVISRWRSTSFLREQSAIARGWLVEVMKAIDAVGRPEFALADIYSQEAQLETVYPDNRNVRPKIRQQLQVLRDRGYLDFLGRGRYRLRSVN